jgi:hypothetical protein
MIMNCCASLLTRSQLDNLHDARFVCTHVDRDVALGRCEVLHEQCVPRPHAKGGTIGGVSDDPTPQDCAELTDRRRVPDSIFEI